MAITQIIAATALAVSGASTEFTTTYRGFWLFGSGFNRSPGTAERAVVESLPLAGGEYEASTNKDGDIFVSGCPNRVFVDLPPGTYRINKTATLLMRLR